MKYRIYPSITTTKGNWRELIKEVDELGLEEICFFPTGLKFRQRKECYALLKKSSIKKIPLVHLRHDMKKEEVVYFMEKFQTRIFNIHSQREKYYKIKNDLSEFNKYIFIETTLSYLGDEVNGYAGICLDTAHVENQRLNGTDLYEDFLKSLERFPIGVTHISAINKVNIKSKMHDCHFYQDLSEFDYVKRYQKYLSEVIAIELENTISEQLMVKNYLQKLLGQV